MAGVTLLEVMLMVALATPLCGLLTARWEQLVRRSRTSEATSNVASLFRGAVAYYEPDHHWGGKPKQFPASVGPTPRLEAVTAARGKRIVEPAGGWDDPSWQALSFAMGEPHHYAYQFISSGIATQSEFTARALGDLDGDGIFSTFERQSSADANNTARPRPFTVTDPLQ